MSLVLLLVGYLFRRPRRAWLKWLWIPIVFYTAAGIGRIVLVDQLGRGHPEAFLATVEGWVAAGQLLSGWPVWLLLMSGLYFVPSFAPPEDNQIETSRGRFRTVWLVCLAAALLVLVSLAGNPLMFIDGAVLFSLLALLFFLILSGMYWTDLPRFVAGLFSLRFVPSDKLEEYRYLSRRAGHVSVLLGALTVLIGLVVMLGNLDNPDMLGPSLALALLPLFYGLVLKLFKFAPYCSELNIVNRELSNDE